LSESGDSDFLKPRLRLFLSADIVGSTAFKQSILGPRSKPEQRIKWVSKIQGFYFEALRAFTTKCSEVCEDEKVSEAFGEQPRLWKTIGDEVLFVKVLSDHRQLSLTLDCWLYAIQKMRKYLRKDGANLDVKSTAWLAGFPFRNSEVAVSPSANLINSEDGDWFVEGGKLLNRLYSGETIPSVTIDYIGPSIDIGFRLTGLSSSRKMVISVDVAYILSLTNPGKLDGSPIFDIYYDGSTVLKGVFGGLSYPVFWIDISSSDALERLEDELTDLRPLSRDKLRQYCIRLYSQHNAYTFPPFIDNDVDPALRERPPWYDDDHAALVANAKLEPLSAEPADAIEATEGGQADAFADVEQRAAEIKKRIIHQYATRTALPRDTWLEAIRLRNLEDSAPQDGTAKRRGRRLQNKREHDDGQ
jgi:hypothetical protein